MPTIIGSKSGTRPHLELDWSVNSQDITNNRSSVKLKLYLRALYTIQYSARYTGTLQGASFTSSAPYISSPGRYLLTEKDVWISHDSNGSKTAKLTADYNLNITWGGVYHGKISLSGNANLGTIPRASTLSAFSFNAHLKNGTENKINYTVSRKSSSFRHQIQLRDGSTTVLTWDDVSSNGATSITLTAANVNTLLNRMKTSTTKSYTLRIATRSGVGGSWIGSAVTRNATATVHADVKPSLSGLSVSQVGNSVSTDYLQNISKVKVSFTRSAGYGASITSSRIIVRRVSGGANSQTINSNDGTTSNAINLTGSYEVIAQATDGRGRSGTQLKATFTSVAYSPPVITNFTATRQGNEGAASRSIDWYRAGRHSGISGKNSATGLLQYRTGSGTWTQIESVKDSAGAWGKSGTVSGLSETNSYEFRFTLTDSFGNSDSQTVKVSTARVVLDIHKNEGVGIGKLHERGELDVGGDAYVQGTVFSQKKAVYYPASPAADLNSILDEWALVSTSHSNIPPFSGATVGHFYYLNTVQYTSAVKKQIAYGYNSSHVFTRYSNGSSWSNWELVDRPETGANTAIRWWRFPPSDGTTAGLMICTGSFSHDFGTTITKYVDLPASFRDTAYYVSMSANGSVWESIEMSTVVGAGPSTATRLRFQRYNNAAHNRVNGSYNYRFIAIGRWN